jgi:hypothetical protein
MGRQPDDLAASNPSHLTPPTHGKPTNNQPADRHTTGHLGYAKKTMPSIQFASDKTVISEDSNYITREVVGNNAASATGGLRVHSGMHMSAWHPRHAEPRWDARLRFRRTPD